MKPIHFKIARNCFELILSTPPLKPHNVFNLFVEKWYFIIWNCHQFFNYIVVEREKLIGENENWRRHSIKFLFLPIHRNEFFISVYIFNKLLLSSEIFNSIVCNEERTNWKLLHCTKSIKLINLNVLLILWKLSILFLKKLERNFLK